MGFVFGLILNGFWYYYWAYLGRRKGKKSGKYRNPALALFEHYHWATIMAIAGFRLNIPAFIGVSAAWFADEGLAQQHKFALGSGHAAESFLIEVLIVAIWIFIEAVYAVLSAYVF